MRIEANSMVDLLDRLLGAYWTGFAQHQTHVALTESWGITGLAQAMQIRIADEPVTIKALLERLLDLGGQPHFTIENPVFGTSVRNVLEIDLAIQKKARPALNEAAEAAAAAHDATTRILIEGILAEEEKHLAWLETELSLLDRLGEQLYVANRLGGASAPLSA